jgi:hypothetical protein
MAAQQPELVAQLRSAAAAEREASFAALLTLEQKHGSTTGAESEGIASTFEACAIPLCELLLKPVAEVDAAEYRRAALVLTAIGGVAHTRVGAVLSDIRKPINFWAVLSGTPVGQPWTPPRSALGVALAKDPASLTAEDALTVAVGFSTFLTPMSTSNGMEPAFEAVGITFLDFAAAYFPVRSPRPAPNPSHTHRLPLSLLPLCLSDVSRLFLTRELASFGAGQFPLADRDAIRRPQLGPRPADVGASQGT